MADPRSCGCCQRRRERGGQLPWCVPAVQPIELFFFQRTFFHLCRKSEAAGADKDPKGSAELCPWTSVEVEEEQEVPLVLFQRAMVRLFRVLKDERKFEAAEYDKNRNGKVGWFEFCSLWKDRGIYVQLTLAERVFLTLEDSSRSLLGRLWSVLIFVAIIVSTSNFVLSTMPEMQDECPVHTTPAFDEACRPQPKAFFGTVDLICVVLFTAEYVVRLALSAFMRNELVDADKTLLLKWMISEDVIHFPTRHGRMLCWATSFSNIIDLAAVVPWYIGLITSASNGGEQDQGPFLKVLRLTRVIRAFRLGRRFEAVIIIARSVRRSIRALNVLVLNLTLGMIFFGALMYFAEQGDWDPDTQAHVRWEDPKTQNKSPFDSIPSCFWWVLVTATTVGYGDDHTPTTAPGKLVAGLTMVWSLCILALPIGVIGGNFSLVWEEYDSMKEKERELRQREETMLRHTKAWGDPLHYSRRLLLELWHDSGLPLEHEQGGQLQSEFLGEVETTLELPTGEAVTRNCREPLAANHDKARRRVSGVLCFEYSWQPLTHTSPDTLLLGRLQVTVIRAENLLNIDWKGTGVSDPYCLVVAYPNSPREEDGRVAPSRARTRTVFDSVAPRWDQTVSFDVCWTQEAMEVALQTDMKQITREISKSRGTVVNPVASRRPSLGNRRSSQAGIKDKERTVRALSEAEVLRVVPELQSEVEGLRESLPQLQKELGEAQRDLHLALRSLRLRKWQGSCLPETWRSAQPSESLSPHTPMSKGDVHSVC